MESLVKSHVKGAQFKPQSPTAEVKQLMVDFTKLLVQEGGAKVDSEAVKAMQSQWDLITERFQ